MERSKCIVQLTHCEIMCHERTSLSSAGDVGGIRPWDGTSFLFIALYKQSEGNLGSCLLN